MKNILRLRSIKVCFLFVSAVLFLATENVLAYDLSDWVGRWTIYRSGNRQPLTLTINDPTHGECLGLTCWSLYEAKIIDRDGSSTGKGKIAEMKSGNSHAVINIPSADRRSTVQYDAHLYNIKSVMSGTYKNSGRDWLAHFCAFKQRP